MKTAMGEHGTADHHQGKNPFHRGPRLAACCLVAFFSFVSVGQGQTAVDSQAYLDRLEWRGILKLSNFVQLSFHDPAGKRSFWISPGQVRNGFEVVEYDGGNKVLLRHGEATRSIALSDSLVVGMEGQPVITPPPLVVIRGSKNQADAAVAGIVPEDDRMAGLWREALGKSPQLQEIDQQFQNINMEEAKVAEALATLKSEDPEYETISTRQKELQEERRVLTEGALTELGNFQGLPGRAKKELADGLRGGYSFRLRPAGRAPAEEVVPPSMAEGEPVPEER